METSEQQSLDIQRIIWHEIGHLSIDILKVESVKDIVINKLNISHINNISGTFNWFGCVEILPEIAYSKIPEDRKVFAFYLVSLVSGCIFETVYLTVYLGKDKSLVNCFDNKENCLGQQDYRDYQEIISNFYKLYDHHRGDMKLYSFLINDFIQNYFEKILEWKGFFDKIKTIVEEEAKIILEKYREKPGNFTYDLTDELLVSLIDKVRSVILDSKFDGFVESTITNFIEFIEPYKPNLQSDGADN